MNFYLKKTNNNMKKSDFRVVEKKGVFTTVFAIQRKLPYKRFAKDWFGFIHEIEPAYLFTDIPGSFTSLSDAEKAIEAIIEEPKYHYFE